MSKISHSIRPEPPRGPRTAPPPQPPSPRTEIPPRQRSDVVEAFSHFAHYTSNIMGHPFAFAFALIIVVVWAACGPMFHYSETWQLVINTGTTIVTFLMIFVLQNAQSRDSRAIQIKLDELLYSNRTARNDLIDLENLTEGELTKYCDEFKHLHEHYAHMHKRYADELASIREEKDEKGNGKTKRE